jgi:hypothetical protein
MSTEKNRTWCWPLLHDWPKWEDESSGTYTTTHLPTGTKVLTGTYIVQRRCCLRCGLLQRRKASERI